MRKNSELGDRVDRWLKHKTSVHSIDIVGTVDQKIVRLRPLAIDGVSLARPGGTSGLKKSGGQRHDAGLKSPQLGKVTAVQRQVEDLALHHSLPETADRALHQLSVRLHFHLLRLRPELEVNVDRRRLVDFEQDSFLQIFLVALGFGPDLIMPNRQFDEDVRTVAIGRCRARQARFGLLGAYRSRLHDRAARVNHSPANAPRDLLRTNLQTRENCKQHTGHTFPTNHAFLTVSKLFPPMLLVIERVGLCDENSSQAEVP